MLALSLMGCDHAVDATPPAVAAHVGDTGSACELPVTIGLAESWKPQAVTVEADDPLAGLARRGPLTMACEIDAKPAGHLGFLRVWTGDQADLRASLRTFIGTDAGGPVYTDLRIGDRPAVEVAYQKKSALDDELNPKRVFAVQTASGIAAVSLDSLDADEHRAMLPAYELAKTTLTVHP